MKYDTAGNQIIELKNCDCGLTGGCLKCNPLMTRVQILGGLVVEKNCGKNQTRRVRMVELSNYKNKLKKTK